MTGPVPAGEEQRRALSGFPRWPAREQNAALGRASAEPEAARLRTLSPTAVATQPALPGPRFALRLSPASLPEGSALKSEVWLPDVTRFQGTWLQARLRTEARARPYKVGMSAAIKNEVTFVYRRTEYGGWGGTFYGSTYKTNPEAPSLCPPPSGPDTFRPEQPSWSRPNGVIPCFAFVSNTHSLCDFAHSIPPTTNSISLSLRPSSFSYMTTFSPPHVPQFRCLLHQAYLPTQLGVIELSLNSMSDRGILMGCVGGPR